MFSKTGSKNRKKAFFGPLVLTLAAAALAPAATAAQDSQSGQKDIPYLSWGVGITRPAPVQVNGGVTPTNLARAYVAAPEVNGGVTPTNLARSYESPVLGVSQPDGYQPQLRGDEPIIIRDAPDGFQPQTRTVEAASASGSGFDSEDLFSGFLLGAALALAAALALSVVRSGPRTAQS
jgi:hypothetical protein